MGQTKTEFLRLKDQVLSEVKGRIVYFNSFFGFNFNRVTIRNTKTRWGSCSKKGNLNFNYKIYYLESRLRDYIIVHELCHLKELNHSQGFWRLVEKIFPDYKNLRRELRRRSIKS